MTYRFELSRRAFIGTACSAAASPLMTPVVLAETPGENRLVVIILRGGMDALGVVQPYGDRALASLRPVLASRAGVGLSDLDGFFGLADPFRRLMPLWHAGELGFVHAISTPYRNKRSHFDGQDLLENGGNATNGALTAGRDGWLNRALGLIPGARTDYAMAVGQDRLLLLEGKAPAGSWSPTNDLSLQEDERRLLSLLYAGDPLFAAALSEADMLSRGTNMERQQKETGAALAGFAADQLSRNARIAAFSIGGWDTHRAQDRAIARPAKNFCDALLTLKQRLGPAWDQTTVLAMTEFGRTARQNGSRGTDHGTGGMMILAGGAVRGRRVLGDWPGLGEGALYQDRDLMPTDDVRRYAAWALAGMMKLDRADLEKSIFPGLDMGGDPGMLA